MKVFRSLKDRFKNKFQLFVIFLVIGLVLGLAAAIADFMSPESNEERVTTSSQPVSEQAESNLEITAWNKATNDDGAVVCDINPEFANGDSRLYVDSGRFAQVESGEKKQSYQVFKSGKTYIWSESTGRESGFVQDGNFIISNATRTLESLKKASSEEPLNISLDIRNLDSMKDLVKTDVYECEEKEVSVLLFKLLKKYMN
jgi:lipopolysaccharide export LptBFGC system permease protein LptF